MDNEQKANRVLWTAGIIGTLAVGYWLYDMMADANTRLGIRGDEPTPQPENLPPEVTPTAIIPTPIPTEVPRYRQGDNIPVKLENGFTTYVTATGERIKNLMTGAVYPVVTNPDPTSVHQCVAIEGTTVQNPQTIDGSIVVLGPDRGEYNDIYSSKVFNIPGLQTPAVFTRALLPDPQTYHLYFPGVVTCVNSY